MGSIGALARTTPGGIAAQDPTSRSTHATLRIFVYPWATNPYQPQLYEALRAYEPGWRITRLGWSALGRALFVPKLLAERARGTRLVHLHWPVFVSPRWEQRLPTVSSLYAGACIRLPRLLGMRLVWTLHNLAPHEAPSGTGRSLTDDLLRSADATIVHTSATVRTLDARGGPHRAIHVIPLAASPPLPPSQDREAVLGAWHMTPDLRLFLFFGLIRPYKGVEELIETFGRLTSPDLRLLIVGECFDAGLKTRLQTLAAEDDRVVLDLRHVSDEELADVLSVAEYVCLPFRQITSSSSAVMALAYGVPLIAPHIGDLVDIDPKCGYLFDPTDEGALLLSLLTASEAPTARVGQVAAIAQLRLSTWERVASATAAVYHGVLDPPS